MQLIYISCRRLRTLKEVTMNLNKADFMARFCIMETLYRLVDVEFRMIDVYYWLKVIVTEVMLVECVNLQFSKRFSLLE
jgi:hypothetical protein